MCTLFIVTLATCTSPFLSSYTDSHNDTTLPTIPSRIKTSGIFIYVFIYKLIEIISRDTHKPQKQFFPLYYYIRYNPIIYSVYSINLIV